MTIRLTILLSLFWGLALVPASAEQPSTFPYDVTWVAVSVDGKNFANVSRPTLTIKRDGKFNGHTGCNLMFGTVVAFDDKKLNFGPIASSRRGCPGAADTNERRFVPALGATTGWRIVRRSLVLDTAKGALVFRQR